MTAPVRPGIDALCGGRRLSWIEGRRVALVTHAAAISSDGRHSADKLSSLPGVSLTAILAPEHGLFGQVPAGRPIRNLRHKRLGIPVFSLYGQQRKPSPAMLKQADLIVFDIQDIGVRSYTFVSTLRLVMESAAELGKPLIVADRPVPLPGTVDGPVLDPRFESFVGMIPAPLVYGMTPGETAFWLRDRLGLSLDLRVAAVAPYPANERMPTSLAWCPPSPQMRSWETGWSYPSLVLLEAFPFLDHARNTPFAFRAFAHPRLSATSLIESLESLEMPGVTFVPHQYVGASGRLLGRMLDGVRLHIHTPGRFRPVECGVALLTVFTALDRGFWRRRGVLTRHLDHLFGTDLARKTIETGLDHREICASWHSLMAPFCSARRSALLYERSPGR